MPKHFFLPEALDLKNQRITVTGDTAHHLFNVMRINHDDEVILCDGNGIDYFTKFCKHSSASSNAIFLIKHSTLCKNEPPISITLYQSLPKGDKLDLIIQKCVELGVDEIKLVNAQRSVMRIKDKDKVKKTTRFQKISESAAGQSMRGKIPIIHPPCNFDVAIQSQKNGLTLFGHVGECEATLKSVITNPLLYNNSHINIWIGPEGGFTNDEVSMLYKAGASPVRLGQRILRTETAAISAIAQIICLCE
ncbi:MAG: 16S rRNA (uracil(1498)-N(3))-methyltransferase [Defluviitaleaceae bacterium]|nr:16S rRNA (uracil(1498)-N(3))-methyltransferase [Defluviitaleaceae bacterium]